MSRPKRWFCDHTRTLGLLCGGIRRQTPEGPDNNGPVREEAMRGLMSEQPLLISMLIQHAARFHGDVEIVSRTVEGDTHRYTYADSERRARQLAQALLGLGVAPGD